MKGTARAGAPDSTLNTSGVEVIFVPAETFGNIFEGWDAVQVVKALNSDPSTAHLYTFIITRREKLLASQEARDDVKHPTMQMEAPTAKNYPEYQQCRPEKSCSTRWQLTPRKRGKDDHVMPKRFTTQAPAGFPKLTAFPMIQIRLSSS
jgi:hypothetical protein